jgi:hypothetical protein
VLYVSERTADDADFGDIKLNKVLAFSDFLAYAILGSPITGADYQRQKFGPVARLLPPIRRRMELAGDLRVAQSTGQYVPTRTLARRRADTSLFSEEQLELVEQVIETLRPQTAGRVSDLSHRIMGGWKVAANGETIPYETFLVETAPPSRSSLEQARGLAESHGWTR